MLWITIDCGLPDHPKMAALPNDSARYGWIVVLTKAKRQRKPGVFASRTHFVEVLGRHARHLPSYISTRLLEETEAGELAIHDWDKHQWAVKKAGQRGDKKGTSEGQEEDSRARNAVAVDVSNGEKRVQGEEGKPWVLLTEAEKAERLREEKDEAIRRTMLQVGLKPELVVVKETA